MGPGFARVSGKAFGVDGLIAENEFACITLQGRCYLHSNPLARMSCFNVVAR